MRIGPLDIYKHLPKKNCGDCGEKTCIGFCQRIIDKELKIEDCPWLENEQRRILEEMTTPSIRLVSFGQPSISFGGEEIMYRHELTFFCQTVIAVEVHDQMEKSELLSRVKFTNEYSIERIGKKLTLQALAIRCKSRDPRAFAECVSSVTEHSNIPLIFCATDPAVLRAGLEVNHKKPLLYAVTKLNWRQLVELAKEYSCPVVVFADNNIKELQKIIRDTQRGGIEEIAVDPGTHPENPQVTLFNFIKLREAAVRGKDLFHYPLVGVPAASSNVVTEAMMASMMITRYADLLILNTTLEEVLLPVLTLRKDIYTDPRRPLSVEPGLRTFGNPKKNSPVLCTTNSALTFHTVASDIESSHIDCYLLVIDSGGIGVESAVAGGQLDAFKARDAIERATLKDIVSHQTIVIPGLAARIKSDLERLSSWKVLVGPRDSSEIPRFLKENWDQLVE